MCVNVLYDWEGSVNAIVPSRQCFAFIWFVNAAVPDSDPFLILSPTEIGLFTYFVLQVDSKVRARLGTH